AVAALAFAAGPTVMAATPAAAANTTPAATAAPALYSRVPVFYKWRWQTPQVRPRIIAWGMGSGLFIRSLHWGHWNRRGAWGRGWRYWNTCNPNCAAGNYIISRATVQFWRWRWHNGQRYWTRLTVRWVRHGIHHKHVYVHSTGQFDTG